MNNNNNEPVLLCEQKGCNAEYHLGCLYMYCDNLFGNDKKDGDNEKKKMMMNVDGNG